MSVSTILVQRARQVLPGAVIPSTPRLFEPGGVVGQIFEIEAGGGASIRPSVATSSGGAVAPHWPTDSERRPSPLAPPARAIVDLPGVSRSPAVDRAADPTPRRAASPVATPTPTDRRRAASPRSATEPRRSASSPPAPEPLSVTVGHVQTVTPVTRAERRPPLGDIADARIAGHEVGANRVTQLERSGRPGAALVAPPSAEIASRPSIEPRVDPLPSSRVDPRPPSRPSRVPLDSLGQLFTEISQFNQAVTPSERSVQPDRRSAANERPVVEVRIGRVEVRTTPQTPKETASTIDLGDYLETVDERWR